MTEVVVVGGGVAGAAAAARLAADGREVLVLEREVEYTDRVRGEGMVPWGLEAARALGLADAVLQAPGASCMTTLVAYDELVAIDDAQRRARSLAEVLPGVPGPWRWATPSCARPWPTSRPTQVRSSFVASSTWKCVQVRRPRCTTRSTVCAIGPPASGRRRRRQGVGGPARVGSRTVLHDSDDDAHRDARRRR